MCVPYPHPECIELSGLSVGGLMVLLGLYVTGNAVLGDPAQFDEGERGFGLLIGVTMAAAPVVAVAGYYTDALPPAVTDLLTTLGEGLGYYVVLAYGPITVAFVALGLGSITVAITHLLLEQYV